MNTEQAITTLADVALGEPITKESIPYILIDIENARRDFTEEEYPEELHLDRLAALAFLGKELA